jgi:DNA-binding MarR family transcriptional regulator
MTNPDYLPHRIASGLSRIAVALRGLAWKRATENAITPTQGEILQQIAEARAPLRLNDIAGALAISSPTASDAVSALVSKGLAVKVAGADKRALAIKLTLEGEGLAKRSANWPDLLTKAATTLTPDEQGIMLRALSKIIGKLQDDGAISAQRICVTCQHFRPYAHEDEANPHHCALIDRAYGNHGLQLNCPDHALAARDQREAQYLRFLHQ